MTRNAFLIAWRAMIHTTRERPRMRRAPRLRNGAKRDRTCMTCHERVPKDDPARLTKDRDFCFVCHAAKSTTPAWVPAMDPAEYAQSTHAAQDCLSCHTRADGYEHDRQAKVNCRACHQPHPEKVTHDAHSLVSCEACHLGDVTPLRDPQTHQVLWERTRAAGALSTVHDFSASDESTCLRCHFKGNTVGAVAMVLPPKSVLCMPCHAATLSVGDTVTWISLLVAFIGFLGVATLWFSGSSGETSAQSPTADPTSGAHHADFSLRVRAVLEAIFWDVFLQRRLFRRSPRRWAVHALIFWPFVIRFAWGVLALFSHELPKIMALFLDPREQELSAHRLIVRSHGNLPGNRNRPGFCPGGRGGPNPHARFAVPRIVWPSAFWAASFWWGSSWKACVSRSRARRAPRPLRS